MIAYHVVPMSLGPSRWLAVSTFALAIATSSAARANDPKAAQTLFDEGQKLMAQERWADACPKLEESQRLDPAGGTLLHLALCREHEGRIATASIHYQDALVQAKRDARKDRAKIAQDRIDALRPQLPRVRLRVAPANRRFEGFTLTNDERVIGEPQWDEQVPVDPGAHVITAKAQGRKTWTKHIEAPARGQELVVNIPELEREPAAQAASGTSPASPDGTPATRLEDAKRGSAQRTAGIAVTGVGVAGVIVGSIFGLVSMSNASDADKECAPPDFKLCSAKGVEAGDSAMSAGNVSTVAFVAGGLLVAGGLVLYFTAPDGSRVAIAPSMSTHGASFGITGRF